MRTDGIAGTLLSLVAFASPSFAQNAAVTHRSGTYVPTAGLRPQSQVAAYSTRGSAVMPAPSFGAQHRGGGPIAQPMSPNVRRAGISLRLRPFADTQTRRPGAANYTGSAFEEKTVGDERNAHTVQDLRAPGVSMRGDDFRTHSSSRMSVDDDHTVAIEEDVSNPEAHEAIHEDMAEAATSVSIQSTAPGIALMSDRAFHAAIDTALYGSPRFTRPVLTTADLAYLPGPVSGTSRTADTFNRAARIDSASFVPSASGLSDTPAQLSARTAYPAAQRAIIAADQAVLPLSGARMPSSPHAVGGGPR